MTTLFVNACMRGEKSRTLALCREYLAGKDDVEEVKLAELHLEPYDAARADYRSQKQHEGTFDDPVYDLAHQLAAADEVVVGAPYWDLSFPSVLKVYIEHVCACGVTFHYAEDGSCVGDCRARRLVYIASAGGFVEGANFGYEYVAGIAKMFGIPETAFVAAEGLDIVGMDVEAQMEKARAAIRKL